MTRRAQRATPATGAGRVAVAVTVGVAVAVAAVVACSSPRRPAASATTRWAGSVCTSARALKTSLKHLTVRVRISLNSPQSSLDQAKQQLRRRGGAVEAAAAAVGAALRSLPAAAGHRARVTERQLQAAGDRSGRSMRQVRAAVARLPSAATPAELMADAAVMGGAVTVAARDVSRLLASLGRAAADSRAGLQRAFGAAPACQHLPRTP